MTAKKCLRECNSPMLVGTRVILLLYTPLKQILCVKTLPKTVFWERGKVRQVSEFCYRIREIFDIIIVHLHVLH